MAAKRLRFAGIAASVLLGAIFLVAGIGKLPGQSDAYTILLVLQKDPFLSSLADYVHIIVPLLELFLGSLLLLGLAARAAAAVSAVMVSAFVFNNLWLTHMGLGQEPCHCFGGTLNWLIGVISTKGALYVDIALFGLIFLIVTRYPGGWLSARPWFLKRS